MKRFMFLTASFALSASMAMASISAGDLVAAYQAQGYARIEVTTGPTQIKVQAIKGSTKVEVVYDATTGAILRQENRWVKRSERGKGVAFSTASDDFMNNHAGDAEDSAGDENDGNANDSNDSGSKDGAGHDAGDDYGGGDDHSGEGENG